MPASAVLDTALLRSAVPGAVRKLDPRLMARAPVMFVVELGAVFSTVLAVTDPSTFAWLLTVWLWLTVLFANFAEAVAEGRGKAQADTLRQVKTDAMGRRLVDGVESLVAASELQVGDHVVCEAGDVIPSDGDVVEGVASVDESAVTGESAPVIRESGGDRSAVTGGTKVLSDRIVVRITARPGETFIDRMIALVEGAARQKTPNEVALSVLLSSLTIVFILAVVTLQPLAAFSGSAQPVIVLIALLVCLIPTTIGALLSAIGIAGMDRLVQRNVLAMSGRAVEAAGDVSTLLLDKTGTITYGNRQASELRPAPGITPAELADAARLSSLADETPEGRSIVTLANTLLQTASAETDRGPSVGKTGGPRSVSDEAAHEAEFVPFSAETRMSGMDLGGRSIRKGASDSVARWLADHGGSMPQAVIDEASDIARRGGTPLVVAEFVDAGAPEHGAAASLGAAAEHGGASEHGAAASLGAAGEHGGAPEHGAAASLGAAPAARALGVVHLKDVVKEGMRERFEELRAMGIRTVMITGDNPLTAAAIAEEAGVDDYLAEAKPEDKMALIRKEQEGGKLVAMTGDGTNDAPALAQADVGVAMNSGTSAAKDAGNMVDLDSDPTKLIEIVEIGKQLLITRGSLTTFSVANDVAKYFAILPAMFAVLYPGLGQLNVMGLASPESAILSAVIFNALVIVALIPLALKGVKYTPSSASALLRRNLAIYGLGGLVAPFVGIKLIDLVVQFIPGIS